MSQGIEIFEHENCMQHVGNVEIEVFVAWYNLVNRNHVTDHISTATIRWNNTIIGKSLVSYVYVLRDQRIF